MSRPVYLSPFKCQEFEEQALEFLPEKRTAKAIQSAALSATFALMAEPAFAAEAGSYDIREEEAKNFMVLFTFGSLFVAAGVVFVARPTLEAEVRLTYIYNYIYDIVI